MLTYPRRLKIVKVGALWPLPVWAGVERLLAGLAPSKVESQAKHLNQIIAKSSLCGMEQ